MNTARFLFCPVVALILLQGSVSAQWQRANGLGGRTVNCFFTKGTNFFAGTDGGVFLSRNSGANWDSISSGLTNTDVKDLASDGANLYAGTLGSGIFLSTDDGTSWTAALNNGLANTYVQDLEMIGAVIFDGTANGVFRSTNNGAYWYAANTGLTNEGVQTLAVSGGFLFAGTDGGGVYLSTNNGTNWSAVSTGLSNTDIVSLVPHGSNIFAGTSGAGVFLSTNNGTSWAAVNSGMTTSYVGTIAVSSANIFAGVPFGGVFLSTNNGASWTAFNSGLTNLNVLSLAVNGTYLFAGTDYGIWRRPLSDVVTEAENNLRGSPAGFVLHQNYPNPFNPTTMISFELPGVGTRHAVSLRVYDLLGRIVATLVDEQKPAGTYHVTWNASRVPSGVYFCRLSAGSLNGQARGSVQIIKLMLLK